LICVCRGLRVPQQEGGRLLGGVSVIVSQNMRIGLQEESNIGVADPLADHLRAYAGFERTGRVGVAQIVEGDPRESCSCREAIETLSDGVGVRWAAVLKGEDIVAKVVVGAEELSLSWFWATRQLRNAATVARSIEIVWSAFVVLPPSLSRA
jgi:hypothetical protein